MLSEWFEGKDTVGVSAGASTPDQLIQKVISKLNEISVNMKTEPEPV